MMGDLKDLVGVDNSGNKRVTGRRGCGRINDNSGGHWRLSFTQGYTYSPSSRDTIQVDRVLVVSGGIPCKLYVLRGKLILEASVILSVLLAV